METDFSGYSQYSEPGFDPSVSSSSSMGLSDEAMASIGSDENQEPSFFGGSDATQNFAFDPNNPNIMDFGRGSVSNIRNTVNYDPNFSRGIKLTLNWYFENKQYYKSLSNKDILNRLGNND